MDFYPSSTQAAGGGPNNGEDGLTIQAVHSEGLTRIIHAPQAHDRQESSTRLFTAGDDYLVRILPSQIDSSTEPMIIDDATKAVTWIDADADYLVTGSEDGCVRIYQHSQPFSELESQMTSPTDLVCLLARSSLAIRCVVLEKAVSSGKTPRVAICSDELVVKVVDAADPKRVQLLTGHSRGMRAASWHPMRPYLATCSCDGTIKIWDLSTTEPVCLKTLDAVLPVTNSQSESNVQALWHPSGEFFVIPSKTQELVAIDASSYRKMGSFLVGSNSPIASPMGEIINYAFSSNGRYIASTTTDGKVTVWDSNTRAAIRSIERKSIKTGISWHPTQDALAWSDTLGQLSRWDNVVGSKYPSPSEFIEYLPASQAKRKKQREEIDDLFGDVGEELNEVQVDADVPVRQNLPSTREYSSHGSSSRSNITKSQPTFQPTSTPMRNGRRYMCLSMLGSLMAIEQDSHQSISFESFDASVRRNWRFADHCGYYMAAIGSAGAFLACPSKKAQGEDDDEDEDEDDLEIDGVNSDKKKGQRSSVYFKPFETPGSWTTSGSEWTLELAKDEEAVAVAVGGRKGKTAEVDNVTAVVATSLGYLRFFSASGLQRYVWSMGSQIVTMAAGLKHLLVIHRGSTGAALDGHQNMSYMMIDLITLTVKHQGVVPLVKGSTLIWVGFNVMDVPALYDSRGVLHILDRCYSASGQARWTPVLDASINDKETKGKVRFWPVGLTETKMNTIFLKGAGLSYPDPSSSSRPLIQEVTLQTPLLNLDTSTGSLEAEYMSNIQLSSFIRMYKASLTEEEEDNDEAVSELPSPSTVDHNSDKALLQLIQSACKSDKHQKVLDVAKELHSTRTLDAALQIGTFFHLSSLVDRMGDLRSWVATRRERDEGLLTAGALIHEVISTASSHKTITESGGPNASTSAAAAAALATDFNVAPKKSYGDGRRSELAKAAHSPSSSWRTERTVDEAEGQENARQRMEKRAREIDQDDADDVEVTAASSPLLERGSNVSSFANPNQKVTSAKNPFARTAGMTRDKSMHKSSSFFERVDASMDNQSNTSRKMQKTNKVKQSTLLSLAKGSSSSNRKPSPAFAATSLETNVSQDQSQQEDNDEGNLRLTLEAAARRNKETQQLQETQYPEDEDTQFDSLPLDVTV